MIRRCRAVRVGFQFEAVRRGSRLGCSSSVNADEDGNPVLLSQRGGQRFSRQRFTVTFDWQVALREALGVNISQWPDLAKGLHLDEMAAVPLKPDILLKRGDRVLWVGDAKYKRLPVGGYRNADLYQLLAYSVSLNLPGGTLIYAADEGVHEVEHVVLRAGKRLRVVALDLLAPRAQVLRQIASLAAGIRLEAGLQARSA